MIDISGDVIYFDGRPVGFITVPNGSLRAGFEEALGYDASAEVKDLESQLRDAENYVDKRIGQCQKIIDSDDPEMLEKLIKILS